MSGKGKYILIGVVVVAAIAAICFFVFNNGGGQSGASQNQTSTLEPAQINTPVDDGSDESTETSESSEAPNPSSSEESTSENVLNDDAKERMSVLGDGNTVLKKDDTTVNDEVLIQRATERLDEGVNALAELPQFTELNEAFTNVCDEYFLSYPNVVEYIYNNVCENKGHLDKESFMMFKADDLYENNYKVSFNIVDNEGNVIGAADGYYQDTFNSFKISDFKLLKK